MLVKQFLLLGTQSAILLGNLLTGNAVKRSNSSNVHGCELMKEAEGTNRDG